MAALSITAASVVPQTGAVIEHGVYGETVTAGQAVYLKSSDNKYWLADADAEASAAAAGIALNNGGADQRASIITEGDVAIGATVAIGEVYIVDIGAGGIIEKEDVTGPTTGDYVTVLGTPISTTVLRVKRIVTGVAIA